MVGRSEAVAGMAIALGLCLTGWPGSAFAIKTLEYDRLLLGDPPLGQPVNMALDPATLDLCVTDEASRSLNVFDRRGLHRFRTDATSRLSSPLGGCIDANGDFVFTDSVEGSRRTIKRLNFLGEPMEYEPERPTEDWTPRQLMIARNGDYVTVDRKALLARHRPDGSLVWTLELFGPDFESRELLGCPAEARDGTLMIPGVTLGRVVRVSADGRVLPGFGVPGAKRGELAFPVAVTVGPEGDVLVLDRMRHVVLIYSENPDAKPGMAPYRFENEYGRLGYRPGDFYYPTAMVADPDGQVFISQGFEGRVQVYHLFDTMDASKLPGGASSTP